MRHKLISVSKAKAKLLEIARKVNEEGEAYILTKDGDPIGAIITMQEYEALLESQDVQSDSATMKHLKAALKDEENNRIWTRDKLGKWTKALSKAKRKTA